ncbi:tyrosine--tRNA ligase [Alkalicoccus chagannorensis]|uniref:tyrosine--tRNA ligase n=1 Tax=Alkalicoccus chagannorensis TaxID=427072 RepID=UPI0004142FDE|nr:tyrosine--tRNA ligase [Alkalicoccus chagannorensis]
MKKQEQLTHAQQKQLQEQLEVLTQGAAEIIPDDALAEKIAASLLEDRPLRVKLGLDPSAPDVHLGHTVVLQKLRQFQDFGHQVQLLIGDFTGRIGDPTGKSTARAPLSEEEVKANAATYTAQFGKVLDASKLAVFFNSSWLAKLQFEEVIQLAGQITVARLLERDDFDERTALGKPIALHEFFYPVMQGYDSVVLESDVELGGTDQHYNTLMGRHFQERLGREKQAVLLLPLLEGLDGQEKMSKSKKNYIGIDDAPADMFGKTMSIPDALMMKYWTLATDAGPDEVAAVEAGLADGSLHPRAAKAALAGRITTMYHGRDAAEQAEAQFNTVFQNHGRPNDIPEHLWEGDASVPLPQLLADTGMLASRTEARRMIENRGVRIDGETMPSPDTSVNLRDGMLLQVGRRRFLTLRLRE